MAHEYITDDGNDLTPDTALVRCGHGDCTWGLPVKPISRIFEFTGAPISARARASRLYNNHRQELYYWVKIKKNQPEKHTTV